MYGFCRRGPTPDFFTMHFYLLLADFGSTSAHFLRPRGVRVQISDCFVFAPLMTKHATTARDGCRGRWLYLCFRSLPITPSVGAVFLSSPTALSSTQTTAADFRRRSRNLTFSMCNFTYYFPISATHGKPSPLCARTLRGRKSNGKTATLFTVEYKESRPSARKVRRWAARFKESSGCV